MIDDLEVFARSDFRTRAALLAAFGTSLTSRLKNIGVVKYGPTVPAAPFNSEVCSEVALGSVVVVPLLVSSGGCARHASCGQNAVEQVPLTEIS